MNDELISRQAAIDALKKANADWYELAWAIDAIRSLPSAQPERNKGKWVDGGMRGIYYCSECNHKIMTNAYVDQRPLWTYCPNCGADMRGDKNV